MRLPRYEQYKDSGLDWLGNVPAHWAVGPLKRGFDVRLGKMLQTDSSGALDVLMPYLRAANIQWAGVDATDIKSMWFSPRDIEQLRLTKGDLLVSEGGDVGRSAIWRGELAECFIQNSVNRVRARGDDSTSFLYYWMATIKAKGYVDVLCNKSTIAHFTAEKVAEVATPYPPPAEQTAIATFLDREISKIDALIAEQEKLIALLAEKRQAIISHAVTKGLDPSAPMKVSGVAWLGEIPSHWKVERVKNVARLESGHTPSKQVSEYWEDCSIPWVSLNDSKYLAAHDYISDTAVRINELGLANSSARMLPPGAVVFTRDATIGLAAITTLPMAVSQHLIAWCPSQRITSLFLLRVFNAMKPYLDAHTFGATIKTIGMSDVKTLVTIVPPLNEQMAITTYIDSEAKKLDALRENAKRASALLKERRAALITAAVTGQIDVRGEVGEVAA
jgi:type I restriction enzyme S subunit